jgi:hypothetical protein
MTLLRWRLRIAVCAVATLGLGVTAAKASTDISLTNLAMPNYSTVGLTFDGHSENVYLGESVFTATIGGVVQTLRAFCVDPSHNITVGAFNPALSYDWSTLTTYSNGAKSGTGTAMSLSTAEAIGGLVQYGLASNNAVVQEAVQAAIWEDMGASLTGLAPDIRAELLRLQAMHLTSNSRPTTFYAANGQTQGFAIGVPEPAVWSMMILGMFSAGLGLRLKRRRRFAIAA